MGDRERRTPQRLGESEGERKMAASFQWLLLVRRRVRKTPGMDVPVLSGLLLLLPHSSCEVGSNTTLGSSKGNPPQKPVFGGWYIVSCVYRETGADCYGASHFLVRGKSSPSTLVSPPDLLPSVPTTDTSLAPWLSSSLPCITPPSCSPSWFPPHPPFPSLCTEIYLITPPPHPHLIQSPSVCSTKDDFICAQQTKDP